MGGGIGTERLTDKAVKAFVAKCAPGTKLSDGAGLFLFITPAGSATWRVKYRIAGKEKLYSIGTYPLVSLGAARVELREVKGLLREGKDPVSHRRFNRAVETASTDNTFEAVAREWLKKKKGEWGEVHYKKSSRALERDIFPFLGKLPVASISTSILAVPVLEICQRDAVETAWRILQHLNGIFRFARAYGLCRDNPAKPVFELLPQKKDAERMPALLDWDSLGDLMRRARLARLSPAVHLAHRLCAFSAARIGNVVDAEWKEFDIDGEQPLWTIPRAKLKVTERPLDLRLPLGKGIVDELRNWRSLNGHRGFVFASDSAAGHIGRESIEKAYRVTLGLDGKHSPHGWRSAFSTLAREHGFERDVVELALDHAHDNEVVLAYDRGERFSKRVQLFSWWNDQLLAAETHESSRPR